MPEAAPVVVVGAGPTGLTTALLLARQGVATLVLERHRGVLDLPRAVHLDDEAVRVLARAGVGAGFLASSRPALGLRVVDATQHRVLAQFPRAASGPHGYPQANLFHQPDLERLLRAEVARTTAVTLVEGATVVDVRLDGAGGVTVVSRARDGGEPTSVAAAAVLGCDGAASAVRDRIGACMVDLARPQRWLVLDVRSRRDLQQWDGVHQVSSGERAATFLRVGGDRYRWEFRLRDGEDPGTLCAGPGLAALLAPWRVGLDDVTVIRSADYTYRAQAADRWSYGGRVFLLGDAAHLMPPFTGQGLGSGLRDGLNLAWKLAPALHGSAREEVLATYQREREPHVRGLIRLARLVGAAMAAGGAAGDALRSTVVPVLPAVPGLRGAASTSATPALAPGPLVRRRGFRRGSPVGTLLPEPVLAAALGDPGVAPMRWLVADSAASPQAVRLARLLDADGPGGPAGPALAPWLAAHRVRAAVVRPDGVVLATAETGEDLCRLYGELHPLFGPPV